MNHESESILVVDDTPLNREVLARQMQRSGYDVHGAADGQEALDVMKRQAFDLVLLDVVMPRVDGLQVLTEIRRTHPPGLLPVIMVTARDHSEDVIKALELGANDYLTKPLELPVVLARVRTQLAMKRSARTLARQAAVLDATTDVVLYADGAGRLSYLNQAGRDLLSVRVEASLPDARLSDCLDGRSAEIFEQEIRPALAEFGVWRGELGLRRDDGEEMEVSAVVLKHAHGPGITGAEDGGVISAILRDIRERKRFERKLSDLNRELETKNREMEQFAYNISHDLKSPLVTCRGYMAYLREDLAQGRPDRLGDFAARIDGAMVRMQGNIEDLLELGRAGRVIECLEPVDMDSLLEDIRGELEERLRAAGVRLEIQAGLPPVMGDRPRLREVLLNLLNNALKYGCDGPCPVVRVGARGEGAEACFWVEDEGPGIPVESQERAFEIFQRLCPDKEGSGVGLALVRKIVEVHGGRVWIDPDYEDGARFCLAFTGAGDEAPMERVA